MRDIKGKLLEVGDRVSVNGEAGVGRWVLSSNQDEYGECRVKHIDSMAEVHRHPNNLTLHKGK